jgi:peptidoglycan/xylan/chitin deacetylase (PgdA/CDA1 family)
MRADPISAWPASLSIVTRRYRLQLADRNENAHNESLHIRKLPKLARCHVDEYDMPGKFELASHLLGASGLTRILGNLRSAVVRDLRVLAYHRILPRLDEENYPFDVELVSATLEEFDWQMSYIARRFHPVSCQQVTDAMRGGRPLPTRAVMVTFDDGFDDNHDVVLPVLVRNNVPGLFFLITGYINTSQVLWFERLVYVILRTPIPKLRLDALQYTSDAGDSVGSRRAAAAALLRLLKRTPHAVRLEVLEELDRVAQVEISPDDRQFSAPMTWDQVRAMADAGMEFGSHTVTHPILSTVTDAAMLACELRDSKSAIERQIDRPIATLAYPEGGRDAINDHVLTATRDAAYALAFTYEAGANRIASADPLQLRRIHVERHMTRHMFASALELPELMASPY